MPNRASRWENGNRVAHAQPFWDDSRKKALGIPAQRGLNNALEDEDDDEYDYD
jgi:hypothetical protein